MHNVSVVLDYGEDNFDFIESLQELEDVEPGGIQEDDEPNAGGLQDDANLQQQAGCQVTTVNQLDPSQLLLYQSHEVVQL